MCEIDRERERERKKEREREIEVEVEVEVENGRLTSSTNFNHLRTPIREKASELHQP